MREKDELGRYGEQVAAHHLRAAGLRVLDRNWRCPSGEIDLVLREGRVLVICEVKTRSGLDYGDPAEAVVPAKAARLRSLGLEWVAAHRSGWQAIRFDVVTVLRLPRGSTWVRHVRGAF